MEFVTEFGLTNQQIVLLNGIDIGSGHDHNPTDFINSPVNGCDLGPFEEIQHSQCILGGTNNHPSNDNNDVHQQHQFRIIKQRNGNRYMKFRKSKKNVKTKLVDQQPQQCPVEPCGAVFTSKLKLRKHVQEHAFKKQHRCDLCFEEFNVLENLMLHISLHSGDGRCPQCGKIFRRLASLEGHIKTHFKNEYYTCTQGCDEMFPLEWMLKQHINQFHPTENAKGQQEKEELAKQRKLKRKNLLNCQYNCGKQFTKNCLLIRHERIHNGQKPFQCDRCDRSFAQKNTLIIHKRRHSDQRMFQCTQCPQTFVQKGNLLSHMAKCHTYKEGEPSFPCNQCSCTFKKIGTLNAHISKFHAAQSVMVDDDLGFKVDDVMKELNDLHRSGSLENELISKDLFFNLPVIMPPTTSEEIQNAVNGGHEQSDYAIEATKSSLKLAVHTSNGMVTHRNVMQRIYGNVRWYVCLYCPKEFRRPSDLVRHIRIHTKEKPFPCPVANCGKKFSVKCSLNAHLTTHSKSSRQHACRVCLQTFQSAEAFDEHCWLTHQDNPIFQCFVCSKLCITNGELKRHIQSHRSPVKVKKSAARQRESEDDDDIQLDIIMKEPIMLTNDGQIEVTTEKCEPDNERKFECSVCPSTFKRKGHLKDHMLSHSKVKSHKCDICFKSFGKMRILNRHMLYHSNEKKFQCGTCNASFISNDLLTRHSLKHTNQRNVMCPYCQKRFKSKATCRIHLKIHKTAWVKQFKEQLKSGTIQFEEEDTTSQTNDHQSVLDIATSTANEAILESLTDSNTESFHETVRRNEDSNQLLFTNLVQETQLDDSRNQFEYFLLLPSNGDLNSIQTGTDGGPESEHFIVHDEQLNFSNLQFIQLEQSTLLELDNSPTPTVPLLANYRLNDELNQPEMDSREESVRNASQVPVPDSIMEITQNVESTEPSNEIHFTNKRLTNTERTRKSSKCINKCEICSKIFRKPIDLRRHIRIHTKEKPFSCTNCPRSFSLKSTLQNHNKNKHSDMKEMHPCTVCWKSFSSKHAVITHTLIHSNSRPFKCEYCTTTFRTRGHLKVHQQIHLREGRKLGVDPSDIKTKKERSKLLPLLNVMQEFTDPNPYEGFVNDNPIVEEMPDSSVSRIERSDTVATTDSSVNTHDLVNTIYQCSSCTEQFSDKDSFSAHTATHKDNLRCPDCHKVFTKPSLLKRHMIVHFGRKEFTCEICQKSYTQKATLQAHMGLHTDASFECSQCHKKFNFKTNLTTHERQCTLLNNHTLSGDHAAL